MLATLEVASDDNWYPETVNQWYSDSGASHHVTVDAENLMQKLDYCGREQVHIGNGMSLSIKHVGGSVFSSPYSSKLLSLHHLLHAPKITKNLLSVSKFA